MTLDIFSHVRLDELKPTDLQRFRDLARTVGAEYARSAKPLATMSKPITNYRASSAPVNGSVPPPPPVD